MLKALVTGAGALLGQGIIKSLRMSALETSIVAVDPDPRAVGLYWADSAHLVPMARDADYLNRLSGILDRERPDIVFIGTDTELPVIAPQRSELESRYRTQVVVSSPEVVDIANDKWLTYLFLKSRGLPYPPSTLVEGVEAFVGEVGFPVVVKPRIGARSIGFRLVSGWGELKEALARTENPIVQQNIGSPEGEYTSGALVFDGRCRAVVTMRRDLRDGNTVRAYVEPDCSHNPMIARIAEQLAPYGPANFQFRIHEGAPTVFEINARFSGTTPLRACAGFNEVEIVMRKLLRGEEIPPVRIEPLVILRYWNETILDPGDVARLGEAGHQANPSYKSLRSV